MNTIVALIQAIIFCFCVTLFIGGLIYVFGGMPDLRVIFWIVFFVNCVIGLVVQLFKGSDRYY